MNTIIENYLSLLYLVSSNMTFTYSVNMNVLHRLTSGNRISDLFLCKMGCPYNTDLDADINYS